MKARPPVRSSSARTASAPAALKRAATLPWKWAVAGCVALALGMRLWALRYQAWVTVDGTEYIRAADALAHGRLFVSLFPPGYPALIAAFHVLVPDRVMAAAAVSVACGALLPWPVWRVAMAAVGERWALLPALAVALHPSLAMHSAVTLSESAYLLALYGALALAVARPLGTGLALGAAFAIRPEALLPAAALVAREGVRIVRRAARPRALALIAAGFLALAIPCWFYFHAEFGAWTLTPKLEDVRGGRTSWMQDEPRLGSAIPVSERFGVIERVARHVPELVRSYPANLLGHTRSLLQLWPLPLLLLSGWGFARRRGLESVPLLHLAVLPLAALAFIPRFVLGVVPALAILATVPLAAAAGRTVRVLIAVAWLAGAGWAAVNAARDFTLPYDADETVHRDAGEWLAGVAEPGAVVTDRKPYVAFYADRPYRVMPLAAYDRIIEFARASGVRYLVVDEGVARVFRPQLLPLLYQPGFRERESRLEMIYVGGHRKGYGIGIFRVLAPGEPKSGKPPYFDVRWVGAPAAAAPASPAPVQP